MTISRRDYFAGIALQVSFQAQLDMRRLIGPGGAPDDQAVVHAAWGFADHMLRDDPEATPAQVPTAKEIDEAYARGFAQGSEHVHDVTKKANATIECATQLAFENGRQEGVFQTGTKLGHLLGEAIATLQKPQNFCTYCGNRPIRPPGTACDACAVAP